MYKEIYLDNSATTRPFDEVIEYIGEINKNIYGNPSSLHTKGIEAEKLVRKARESIAGTLGVDSKEIYFTSGGTESNNLAIRGFLEANPRKGNHIITTAIEHPSVLEVFKYLAAKGYKVDYIDVDSKGLINLEQLKARIGKETALISLIYVNNEVGTIQPVEEIVRIKNSINRETVIHMDAVQAYGKLAVAPKKIGIDMMSVSSHKIHGPKGVGALYVDKSVKIKPIVFGGGQETLLRSGTENVPGICGFGLAAETVFKSLTQNYEKVTGLRQLFIKKLEEEMEDYRVLSSEESLPYIFNISFANLKSEVLLHHLEEKNIFVSTGSACSSRKNIHSHVLRAIGLDGKYIDGAIRFSFSAWNTENDIEKTVEALKEIVPKIQIKRGGKR